MRWMCAWFAARAARSLAGGVDPMADRFTGRHARACSRCRAEAEDLRALVATLGGCDAAPEPTERFADAVWARIDRPGPSALVGRRLNLLAPAAGAAVACACLAWLLVVRTGPPGVEPHVSRVTSRQASAGRPSGRPSEVPRPRELRVASAPGALQSDVGKRDRRGDVRRRAGVAVRRLVMAAGARTYSGSTTAAGGTGRKLSSWQQWAKWYEASGAYAAAADAYARAYSERPDADRALAAGRAAEMSGDTASAVEYYGSLLGGDPDRQAQPGERTHLWTSGLGTS